MADEAVLQQKTKTVEWTLVAAIEELGLSGIEVSALEIDAGSWRRLVLELEPRPSGMGLRLGSGSELEWFGLGRLVKISRKR